MIFSKCCPMALSSQPSSVWVVICMKCSVLSCLSCLVYWLSDNDAADARAVRRVHIRLKRKWEGLMATDGRSIRAAGDNISDGRLDMRRDNIAEVTYEEFWGLLQKGRASNRGLCNTESAHRVKLSFSGFKRAVFGLKSNIKPGLQCFRYCHAKYT